MSSAVIYIRNIYDRRFPCSTLSSFYPHYLRFLCPGGGAVGGGGRGDMGDIPTGGYDYDYGYFLIFAHIPRLSTNKFSRKLSQQIFFMFFAISQKPK